MISSKSVWGMIKDLLDNDVLEVTASGVPTNGTSGTGNGLCGPGSTYRDTATGNYYINLGTKASPIWSLQTVVQYVSGTISSANITGTAAGQLGHANGFPIIAAPGAGLSLELISLALYYTFGVAAYTAGGDMTVNWGAGGASVSGRVTKAYFLGAAASKELIMKGTDSLLVSNASINLVAATGFTNPGTATGTVGYEATYRVLTPGF